MNASRRTLILAGTLALLLAGCSSKDDAPPPPKEKQGRAETQSIRNTEAVGYSGNAIANKIDNALNKNDEQVKKTQQAADESP